MRRTLALSILVFGLMVAGGGGIALAQEKSSKDVHVDVGWKTWFVTFWERGSGGGAGGTNANISGIMSGPTFSINLDQRWTLAAAYLSTDLGQNMDAPAITVAAINPVFQISTRRSDLDITLRHRVTDWLGVYLNFKRLDFEQGEGSFTGVDRGSIQGIGFGLSASHPVWAPPIRNSSVFLTGTATYLPLSWTDFVQRSLFSFPFSDASFRAKPTWTNIEAGVGYSRQLDPVVVSVVAAYRYQNLTLETEGANLAGRDFQNVHLSFYGPTVALNIHW